MTAISSPTFFQRSYARIHNSAVKIAGTSIFGLVANLSARAGEADRNPVPIAQQRRAALIMAAAAILLLGLAFSPVTDCVASAMARLQP